MKPLFSLILLSVLAACTGAPVIEDPRISRIEMSQEDSNILLDQINSLEGEESHCFERYLRAYNAKVFEHCEQEGYAENTGGGCYHVVNYSLHNALFVAALQSCNIDSNHTTKQ